MSSPFSRPIVVPAAIVALLIGAAPAYAAVRGDRATTAAVKAAVQDIESGDVRVEVTRVSAPKTCNVAAATVAGSTAQTTWTFRVAGTSKRGAPCEGWAWAKVRVLVASWVTTRTVPAGSSLEGAVKRVMVARRSGAKRLTTLHAGQVARTKLARNKTLQLNDVIAAGPPVGSSLTIRLRAGSLVVAAEGTRVPCSTRDTAGVCARTTSGTRVSGTFTDGALWVRR